MEAFQFSFFLYSFIHHKIELGLINTVGSLKSQSAMIFPKYCSGKNENSNNHWFIKTNSLDWFWKLFKQKKKNEDFIKTLSLPWLSNSFQEKYVTEWLRR